MKPNSDINYYLMLLVPLLAIGAITASFWVPMKITPSGPTPPLLTSRGQPTPWAK